MDIKIAQNVEKGKLSLPLRKSKDNIIFSKNFVMIQIFIGKFYQTCEIGRKKEVKIKDCV